MPRPRRWLAVLCMLLLVASALLAPVTGGSPPSVLIPLPVLFGLVVIALVRRDDPAPVWSYPAPAPLPSRAPPRQFSAN